MEEKTNYFNLIKQVEDIKKRVGVSAKNIPNMAASDDFTSVPDNFEDLAAVQSYLSDVMPQIEARVDKVEDRLNDLLTSLKNAGIVEPR